MFILNPDFEMMVAPKGSSYYLKFNQVENAISYVVFRSNDIASLEEDYQRFRKEIEEYDFSNGSIVGIDGVVDTKEKLFAHLMNTIERIDSISSNTFMSKDIGNEGYDQKFTIGVFAIFDSTFNVYDGVSIVEKNNLKCSLYETKNVHTHSAEPLLSGRVNTNNKISRWSWSNELYENFQDVSFEVSVWRGDHIRFSTEEDNWECPSLINTKVTQDDYFVFSEYVSDLADGGYQLIVNAINNNGSISAPASYNFFVKTEIEDDISISIISVDETETSVINTRTPTFKLENFEPDFDYRFTFNGDPEHSYLYSESNTATILDNSLIMTADNELEYGFNTLTVQKMDKVGNVVGSSATAPKGLYGGSYISFVINPNLVPAPVIIGQQWIDSNQIFISWKSDVGIRDFMVYQGSNLIDQTRDSFITFIPSLNTTEDTIINIYSYDYFGNRSLKPLVININELIIPVNSLTISSSDSIWIDGTEYINNPRPSFTWMSNDSSVEDVIYYRISLDGSNWRNVTVNYFTYLDTLQDGSYTFRVIPVYKGNKDGSQYFFPFRLNTKIPSAPIFDSKTIDLLPTTKEDMVISWMEILNSYKYQVVFNENFVDESTDYIEVFENFIELKDIEEVTFGINTISVRSVDSYDNKSNISKFAFYLKEPGDEEAISEDIIKFYPPDDNYENIICSNSDSQTINISGVVANASYVVTTVYNKYDAIVEQFTEDYPATVFTNSNSFTIDGLYTFNTKWIDSTDHTLLESNSSFLYAFAKTTFSSINHSNGLITWDIASVDKTNYTYKFSISSIDNEFNNYINTDGRTLNLGDIILPGTYFINVKCYDKANSFLNDVIKLQFQVSSISEETFKTIAMPGETDKFLSIDVSPNTNSFSILAVVDNSNNPIDGFLEYKSAFQTNFNLYQDNLLNLDTNYNFIFNELRVGV